VRLTYLKATAVLLARHLLRTRGHDYRLALAGFLTKLGFDEAEARETGLAIINLMADGNEQDWRTVCRKTSQKSNVVRDISEVVDDARVAQHIRAWFGVRTQQQRTITFQGANSMSPQVTEWLWDEYIPLGAFGLHSGREGLGKSATAFERAARITRGDLPG